MQNDTTPAAEFEIVPAVIADENSVDLYREITHDARVAYFDSSLSPQARDERNNALMAQARQVAAELPADLRALVQREHDVLTVAYEETISGGTAQDYRTGRAKIVTDLIAAHFAARS